MVKQLGGTEMGQHADHENADGQHRQKGDDEHGFQRLAGAPQVDADEDQVAGQVHQPAVDAIQRVHITPDEYRDGGRRQGVLQQDGRAGQIAAPGTQHPTGETVATPGGGQAGREFGQASAPGTDTYRP